MRKFQIKFSFVILVIATLQPAYADVRKGQVERIETPSATTHVLSMLPKSKGDIMKLPLSDNRGEYIWEYIFLYHNIESANHTAGNDAEMGFIANFGEPTNSDRKILLTEWLDTDGCVKEVPMFFYYKLENEISIYAASARKTTNQNLPSSLNITVYRYIENSNHNPGISDFYFQEIGAEKSEGNLDFCNIKTISAKIREISNKIIVSQKGDMP